MVIMKIMEIMVIMVQPGSIMRLEKFGLWNIQHCVLSGDVEGCRLIVVLRPKHSDFK